PAIISNGPSVVSTAFFCCLLKLFDKTITPLGFHTLFRTKLFMLVELETSTAYINFYYISSKEFKHSSSL
ncbi:hypothetical protein, partial [Priestia megaterium]|uniref:hypothetical protein n=1 Tax=Priestia megaterium TaxID=1404 RepID=UPI00300B5938